MSKEKKVKSRLEPNLALRRQVLSASLSASIATICLLFLSKIVAEAEDANATREFLRTPEDRFNDLPDYSFAPHYHTWQGLRMHYLDEGSGPIILLMHGQPRWSYLYRNYIPPLVKAGYRCIAPDYIGFGKSDKVVDDAWYTIEHHIETIRSFITDLDLQHMTLVAHDWGGPIGLRQAVDMPERFDRLIIHNTWLHHEGFPYTDAMKKYHARIKEIAPKVGTYNMALGKPYKAPFPDATFMAGIRRFPLMHPYANPVEGNAADQARCYEALKKWPKPVHFIYGESDPIFPPVQGRDWASQIPGATFDTVPGSHFLQDTSSHEIVAIILDRIKGEKSK